MPLAASVEAIARIAGEPVTLYYDTSQKVGSGIVVNATIQRADSIAVNGTSVQAEDIYADVPAASLVNSSAIPRPGGWVERGTEVFNIVYVETKRLNGETLSFSLQLRRPGTGYGS